MLSRLSGTCHEVVTGVALIDAATGENRVWAETTQVYFRQLHVAEITAYIESGETSDKRVLMEFKAGCRFRSAH